MDSIVENSRYLIEQVLLSVRKEVTTALDSCNSDHTNLIANIFDQRSNLFDDLEIEALQMSYAKKHFN